MIAHNIKVEWWKYVKDSAMLLLACRCCNNARISILRDTDEIKYTIEEEKVYSYNQPYYKYNHYLCKNWERIYQEWNIICNSLLTE